jgi:site-specific recombinase XerD
MSQQKYLSDQVPTLSQAVNFFYQYARLHGRSNKTLSLYEWIFARVYECLGDPPLDNIGAMQMRQFLTQLMERGWKMTSISIAHRVLNAFFNWSVREQLIAVNPLINIPAPKTPKLFPFTLEDHQIAALLQACNTKNKYGCRNYAMLLLFIDCGLRLNELINIKLSDVSLTQRSLKVFGKGSKDRIVYMGAGTSKAVKRWSEIRSFRPGYAENLFIDRKGDPVGTRWVQKMIARLGERAGLKVKLLPHKLRHVSATLAVRNGMDAFTLQRLYGWEKIETAMRYVNAAAPQLREAHAKASPVDRLLEH